MDVEESIVELISQELSKLSENSVNPESEIFSEDEISDCDEIIHEIPDSVLSCFQLGQARLNSIGCLIEEVPDRKGSVKDHIVTVIPNSREDLLKELAAECGEDIITLQKRIISEIDEEEKESISCTEDPQSAAAETEFMPHDNEDADEYVETERLCRAELRNLDMRLKAEQEKRMAEHELMKERFEKSRKEAEEMRMCRNTFFEEELRRIECDDKVQQHFELDTEDNETNDRMAQEFSKHQELIMSLQKCISEERQAFEEVWAEPGRKTEEKRSIAATEIRACRQAFMERTENAAVLGERREERRLRKEAQLRAERERKEKEENVQKMLKELEDQRIRWQEERRRKEEERIRERESKRQEEERLRHEEEKKREERIRREEKEKKEEEERRLRLEEEREREAERISLEKERRRHEEERIRQDEKRRKEEERRRQEEERIKQEEEKRRQENVRRQEVERIKQDEEKRQEEERRRQEEERTRHHQLKEMERRKADELRKRVEEERIRNQQERGSKEKWQEEEALIPGVKERSQPEIVHPSISILYSEELDRGKQRPGSNDVVSGQSEEKHYNCRIRCSSQTSQSSVGCCSNETPSSFNSGDEPCQQQGEALPSVSSSDDTAADISERPNSVEQECVERAKDFIPTTKPSPESKRKAVLNTTIVNKGSVKPLPPLASGSNFQSASWDSQSQGLTARQLDHSAEDSRTDEQKWLAELKEIRARHRASLVCEMNAMTECSKRKVQQLHMEKERMETEDRARKEEVERRRKKEKVEQERCATKEAEREHVEMVPKRDVQEERQLALTAERESREPNEQVMSLRKTEGSTEEKERLPEERPNPLSSNVKGVNKVTPKEERFTEDQPNPPGSNVKVVNEATPKEERFPEDQPNPPSSNAKVVKERTLKEEQFPEDQLNPPGSNVEGVKEATPNSDLQPRDPAQTVGNQAEISEVVTEIDDVKGQKAFSSLMCLPDSAERKRLQWMKECVPWTKLSILNKRKRDVRGRSARRSAVKALPPLHAETILQATACNSLKQVTTVRLEDLPGCSLSTLSECTKLQALTLRRCGLLALEGLDGCRDLRHIDVQENNITFLNCKDLTNLQVLLLSRNQLTSIHGLEDAANLNILELSYNCISCFSGLASQKQLQRLLIDHNQIISTRGLSELYTLLYLDCGFNHLTDVSGIENCALLRTLKVQGNSLTKPPSLGNHVLMTELYLDDNIISSLDCLSACWLPQLQLISVSKNCITHLSPLSDCVFLEKLDISDNCLSELANVCHSLKGCTLLQEVNLSGNPFQQERHWRSSLLQTVPGLLQIDGKWVSSTVPPTGWAGSPPPGSFMAFCRAQLLQLERVRSRHEAQLCTSCPLEVPTIISQHCEELLLLAEEQRNAHEFGDLTVVDHAEPATTGPYLDQDVLPVNPVEESAQDADTVSSCSLEPEGNGTTPSSVLEPSSGSKQGNAGSHNADATRGYCTDQLEKHIEDKPTKKFSRNFVAQATILEEASQAATVIQAAWRDYVLRKRLASALTAVRVTEIDEEFPEVNLDEFEFDEAAFDSDWITLDLEHSPPKTLPSCEQPLRPKSAQWSGSSAPPWQPRLGWLGEESERAASSGRPSLSPEMTGLKHRTKSPLPCVLGLRKEKSEKIMKEWGLRDMNTAELMLKRAQKMKPKKKKDRRLRDPGACLDSCRDNENRLAPLKIPKRNQPEKNGPVKDCLAASEAELDEQKRISRERTDLWLQAQANYTETGRTSPAMESDCFLPEIDAKILSGRRVQLMSVSALPHCCQPGQGQRDGLDQESESWASAAALSLPRKEHNQTRANAVGHAKGETPAPVPDNIGPTKRKERISFRDNPVQHSLGWGGGKKRSKQTK